jgi:hypothetical protein
MCVQDFCGECGHLVPVALLSSNLECSECDPVGFEQDRVNPNLPRCAVCGDELVDPLEEGEGLCLTCGAAVCELPPYLGQAQDVVGVVDEPEFQPYLSADRVEALGFAADLATMRLLF